MSYVDSGINCIVNELDVFTKDDFGKMVLLQNPGVNISRLLAHLIDAGKVIRIKRNLYETVKENRRRDFNYILSEEARKVKDSLITGYPLIELQVWESRVLNLFLNHLLSHNLIFMDVENTMMDTVFDFLMQKEYHVLFNPDSNTLYRYAKDNTVIVRRLISQSPVNTLDTGKISLERLLVDIVADKLLNTLISRSELPEIYNECLSVYNLNTKKIIRYATRRNAQDAVGELIEGTHEV